MYYPYLRAKQYELKALREFSVEHKEQNSIIPILEPVKQQPNALNLAIDEMLTNGLKFALILNPKDGDFKHLTVHFDAWFQNEKLMENKDRWIPAFLYSKRNAHEISSIIDEYKLGNTMIIFRTCMDMDDESAWGIINNESVGFVVNSFGSTISRRLRSRLKETDKQIIRLDDCFKSRVRNADYALEVDELFSEEPFFYSEVGNNKLSFQNYIIAMRVLCQFFLPNSHYIQIDSTQRAQTFHIHAVYAHKSIGNCLTAVSGQRITHRICYYIYRHSAFDAHTAR